MEVTAKWRDGVCFDVTTGSGAQLATDGPAEYGGQDQGARPMELLLASVATCSASDIVVILSKSNRAFRGVEVTVSGTRADSVPAVFTAIKLQFKVPGAAAEHAKRAIELSVEKYCSALRMLADAAEISWEYLEDAS